MEPYIQASVHVKPQVQKVASDLSPVTISDKKTKYNYELNKHSS